MTVESVIGGGFGLVRERPGAVAIWGLLYLLATAGMAVAMRPVFGPGADGGSPSDLAPMIGGLLLFQFLFLILVIALLAAAQRAVIEPERPGFAYLRLGLDELRLFGLAVLFAVLFYIGMLAAAVVLTIVIGLVATAAGAAAAVPVAFVEVLLLIAVALWFQVRLSLAFPLTLMRDRFVIGEAWRVTRGRFWTLFGAFLVIFLVILALWIAAALATSGSYLADLARSGFSPEAVEAAGERQLTRSLGGITVTAVVGWVVNSAAAALGIAIFGGAVATAARELTTDIDALADTFA